MDIELATGGSASSAATLVVQTFRQCDDGVVLVDNSEVPGGTSGNELIVNHINGETTQTRDGGRSAVIRAKVRTPLAYYNTNGTIVNTTPEISAHVVVKVPSIVAKALAGQLTTSPSDGITVNDAAASARWALARAISYIATIATGQPINVSKLEGAIKSNPLFFGMIGVCPLDYQNGDYGTIRVLPPPAQS